MYLEASRSIHVYTELEKSQNNNETTNNIYICIRNTNCCFELNATAWWDPLTGRNNCYYIDGDGSKNCRKHLKYC